MTEKVFDRVVARMEPVAEQECRARTDNINCNFLVRIDRDRSKQPNAYQSLNSNGRPILTFNVTLIEDLENEDQLAFIFGHEAAHHIRQHIAQQRTSTQAGALIGSNFGRFADAVIGSPGVLTDIGTQAGAFVGARGYSKAHELEADQLGAILTDKGGYDPEVGVTYFERIRDPGNVFLGTHPPNADRIRVVRETAAQL
ncbi:MAG: M48 family metalloprotease [Pseudomonadota bacterium]